MNVKGSNSTGEPEDVVVRKAERGWVVGDEKVSDLTSAMVLADLFAADQADTDDTTLVETVDEDAAPRNPARASAPRAAAERVRAAPDPRQPHRQDRRGGRGRRGGAARGHRRPA